MYTPWLICGAVVLLFIVSKVSAHGDHHHQPVPPDQRPTSFNDPKITQDEQYVHLYRILIYFYKLITRIVDVKYIFKYV
jgi:hypothetical protein